MTRNERRRVGDRFFYTVNDGLLLLALLAVIYPIVYIFSASFSSPDAVLSGRVWLLPVEPSLEGYRAVFRHSLVLTGYANTIFYTVAGTAVNVVMTIIAAYPLSRRDLQGRNLIMFLFSFTMLFTGGLIPNYIVIRSLGMLNTRWAMILPQAIGVWNLIIARTFFQQSIPPELQEAAAMDGCSDFYFLWKVVVPLSKAIIAVLVLFYGVFHWNAFFHAFIYLSDKDKFPLQIVLREILILNEMMGEMMVVDPELQEKMRGLANLLKYSLIIVASLPVWLVYPFVQKQFVKGVMIGSLKG
jgi:multiple sugar transport system permease protein/putative aldouronate transport system permease protein